jgi:DNA-3-methyladenine glycosylase
MYHCLNFTADGAGPGAVLIRAVEPTRGLGAMALRRGTSEPRRLASGPGRLCQAFGIDLSFNEKLIGKQIKVREAGSKPKIATSRRVGISSAVDLEWRFFEEENVFVSR